MQATYLLLNPTNNYAMRIMAAARQEHGLRPVVVWLTRRDAHFWRPHFPILRSGEVLAHLYLDQMSPQQLAASCKGRYDVAGVIAYQEQTLLPAAALCEALGLAWNAPTTLRRFRDKNGLKEHLRAAGLQVEPTRQVKDAAQLFAQPLPDKFVLKPNDGMANRDVGFFNTQTPRAEIEAYFASLDGKAAIVETLLEGPEFAINGQMDHRGKAWVLNITQYDRAPGNGKANLYRFLCHVPRSDAAFAPLQAYAVQLMEASGLRRAPFHMEAILTASGPQLIEVAARFGGLDYVFITNAVHDHKLDAFALATHYWLHGHAYAGPLGDWEAYDAVNFVQLDGICRQHSRLYRVEGMAELEALPEFFAWVFRPQVGQLWRQTVDLFSIPYSFQLRAKLPLAQLRQKALAAEKLLRFNENVSLPRRLWVQGKVQSERLWRSLALRLQR